MQLGKLAADRAQSEEVKKFARRMVDDHQKAYDEVQKLAESKNVSVPSEVSATKQKDHDRLSKMSGADFDRAYMQAMVKDHNHDVKTFQDKAKNATDPDVASQVQAGGKTGSRGSASPATTQDKKAPAEKK